MAPAVFSHLHLVDIKNRFLKIWVISHLPSASLIVILFFSIHIFFNSFVISN
jgi:hypothetical protein